MNKNTESVKLSKIIADWIVSNEYFFNKKEYDYLALDLIKRMANYLKSEHNEDFLLQELYEKHRIGFKKNLAIEKIQSLDERINHISSLIKAALSDLQ